MKKLWAAKNEGFFACQKQGSTFNVWQFGHLSVGAEFAVKRWSSSWVETYLEHNKQAAGHFHGKLRLGWTCFSTQKMGMTNSSKKILLHQLVTTFFWQCHSRLCWARILLRYKNRFSGFKIYWHPILFCPCHGSWPFAAIGMLDDEKRCLWRWNRGYCTTWVLTISYVRLWDSKLHSRRPSVLFFGVMLRFLTLLERLGRVMSGVATKCHGTCYNMSSMIHISWCRFQLSSGQMRHQRYRLVRWGNKASRGTVFVVSKSMYCVQLSRNKQLI